MSKQMKTSGAWLVPAILMITPLADAAIVGTDPDAACPVDVCFSLTARSGHIALGDGHSLLAWGYGQSTASTTMQYPGPTLIVDQGDTVQVTLENADVPLPVSIVFPGHAGVTATGGSAGPLTNEIAAGPGSVSYTFTASNAGTYLYQSGSVPELEIEMGLVGTIIVRPNGFSAASPTAYSYASTSGGDAPTAYDREFLFFLTDMDRKAHDAVETALTAGATTAAELVAAADPATYSATLWFINGRNGPDTMHPDAVPWLPLQPYGALARMHPGERSLMRILGAGRDLHPFHHHGNNAWLIARDGRTLGTGADAPYPDYLPRPPVAPLFNPELAPGGTTTARLPDQSISNFTIQIVPGGTYDAIFTWTGLGLNWDIYGNRPGHLDTDASTDADCNDSTREPNEDPNSHCKPITVVLPEQQALTFGGLWSGSPYLGVLQALPPDQGGLNPGGGFSYMWHSHTERELANDDIFPGGMLTMMIIEAFEVDLD